MTISFPVLGKFSTIISSNIFSDPFFFSYSGTPIIRMLVCLVLSQRSLRLSSILFILFTLFCFLAVISTILSSSSLIRSSASVTLLLIPSSVFFHLSYCIVHLCLFFISSRSLLNISFIFSVHACIIFPRFWITFTIITLNSFQVDCLFPLFIWSCRFLPFCFICDIFFCHLISFFNEWDCVPVLLVVWPEASNTGVCRLLGRAGSWC